MAMNAMELQSAVDVLWDCRQQGIYYPPDWKGKLDVNDGYRVQLGILAKHLKSGQRQTGWKVGLTAKAIQKQVNFHEPVFGFLLESCRLESGAVIPFDDLVAPSFEEELCVVLGATLKGPNVTTREARAAIVGVAPAIELVEKRGDFTADLGLSMADNVQQRFYITGPFTQPLDPSLDLKAVAMEMFINGERIDSATGVAVLGDPAASVAWLANKLTEFGRKLESGMQVMTGSFTKQYPVAQGDLIEARFEPLGAVSVEFA